MRGGAFGLCVLILFLSGCESGPAMAPVSGRILVDGQPVADLRVAFAPIGAAGRPYPGPTSFGRTDANGVFRLASGKDNSPGAVVGDCKVRIEARVLLDPNKPPREPVKQLPDRYNTRTALTFTVPAAGTDKADFNLSWK